jgi:hypothetical protein
MEASSIQAQQCEQLSAELMLVQCMQQVQFFITNAECSASHTMHPFQLHDCSN